MKTRPGRPHIARNRQMASQPPESTESGPRPSRRIQTMGAHATQTIRPAMRLPRMMGFTFDMGVFYSRFGQSRFVVASWMAACQMSFIRGRIRCRANEPDRTAREWGGQGIDMTRYRFDLPSLAIGQFRLSKNGLAAGKVSITPLDDPNYVARVDEVSADNLRLAYQSAKQVVDGLFGLIGVLGDDAAFIHGDVMKVQACNLDLRENPTPADQPPPPLESMPFVIANSGQEYFGKRLDPGGSLRRSGAIVIGGADSVRFVPSEQQYDEIGGEWCRPCDRPG